jgi:hypothetical protein
LREIPEQSPVAIASHPAPSLLSPRPNPSTLPASVDSLIDRKPELLLLLLPPAAPLLFLPSSLGAS